MEPEWRAGIKPVQQLSKEYGVSRAAILKHWDKLGIERDLAAKIQAKADALVTQAQVTREVTEASRVTETEIIMTNAAQTAAVRLGHRSDIARLRKIAAAQMEELELSCGPEQAQRLRDLGEMMRSEDDKGMDKLNDLYRSVISLPERTKTGKALAETLRIAIDLERREFGMDKTQTTTDPLTELIQRINSASSSAFKPVPVDPAYSGDDE